MIFSVFEQFQFHIGAVDVCELFYFLLSSLLTHHISGLYDCWNTYYLYVMWIYSVVIDPINKLGNSGASEGAEAMSHILWFILTDFKFVYRDMSFDWAQLETYFLFKCEAYSRFLSDFIDPLNKLLTENHNDVYANLPFPYFCYFYNDGLEKLFYLYIPFSLVADIMEESIPYTYWFTEKIIRSLDVWLTFIFLHCGFYCFLFFWFACVAHVLSPLFLSEHRPYLKSLGRTIYKKVYTFFYELVYSYLKEETRYFFPFILFIFLFISILNLVGLIPYSFALTSHLIVTFSLAVFAWGAALMYGFEKHGLGLFSIFFPEGIAFHLVPLFCILEVLSHITRVISLALRLFSNIVAGHLLLDLISVFLFKMSISGIFSIKSLVVPVGFGIILVLFLFEVAISLLQGYIFAVLSCIYFKDYLDLYH